MPKLKLTVELPLPELVDEEELGQLAPEVVRFLVGALYAEKPDSLPHADVVWEQA